MSNFKSILAQASGDVYNQSALRRSIDEYQYMPSISGPRTAVYSGPDKTIVAHRGLTPDRNDAWNTFGRVMIGRQIGPQRLQNAHNVAHSAIKLGKPLHQTGHSLGGQVARKVARDRQEPNTTFNRWAGFVMNPENAKATKECRQGSQKPHCHNTLDVYNNQDIATMRINSDYGTKERRIAKHPYSLSSGSLKVHSGKQFEGGGSGKKTRKKDQDHPQQKLLNLAMRTLNKDRLNRHIN